MKIFADKCSRYNFRRPQNIVKIIANFRRHLSQASSGLLTGPGLVSGSRFRDNNKGADRSTLNDSQKCGLKNKYFFSVENIFVVCTAAFHGPVIFIYSWFRDQTTRRNVRSPLSDSVNILLGRVDREACIWMELKYPLILCQ